MADHSRRATRNGTYALLLRRSRLLTPREQFRNQYDGDISTFSPQGRLHQIEYALEAVKQGSAAVGVKSATHAVLLALKRQGGELASYQKKLIKLDNHLGVAIAGLTSDARVLSSYMRNECIRHKIVFARPLPTKRAVSSVAAKAQINTQQYGSRPYGVGLLVAGYDASGSHLYECSPAGNAYEYVAQAIGSRSQSARTYLEKKFESFDSANLDDLIHHGLLALRDTLQTDKELSIHNVSIGVVGDGVSFHILESDNIQRFIDRLAQETDQESRTDVPASDVTPMETE